MSVIDASLFQEPEASRLEQLRMEKRRTYTQITYDCHRARVTGDVVVCPVVKGFTPQPLRKILRGHSSQVCHKCERFEGGE